MKPARFRGRHFFLFVYLTENRVSFAKAMPIGLAKVYIHTCSPPRHASRLQKLHCALLSPFCFQCVVQYITEARIALWAANVHCNFVHSQLTVPCLVATLPSPFCLKKHNTCTRRLLSWCLENVVSYSEDLLLPLFLWLTKIRSHAIHIVGRRNKTRCTRGIHLIGLPLAPPGMMLSMHSKCYRT